MNQNHKKLMDQAINHIDWNSILKIHEAFGLGVGMSNIVVPGLRKKDFDEGIAIKDLKNELRCIVRYMIENDIAYFNYSNWTLSWSNDLWDLDMNIYMDDDDVDDPDNEMIIEEEKMEFRPKLEIVYCIQKITLSGEYSSENKETAAPKQHQGDEKLEVLLQKALESENYEQASKIRDLIKSRNNKSNEDK